MRDRFLWIGCAAYAALLAALGVVKYDVHRNLVDFGIFAQTVASAFGCFCNPLEGSHWAFHFSPVLYAVAIAVWFVHSPLTLIVLQAIAGALCAPPIYAIVRARAGVAPARLAALVVWLYPPLAGTIFGDFHENGFAPAAVAWALYAFDARSFVLAGAAVLAALAVKEDQAIFLAVAGGAGAFVYRSDAARRTFCLAAAALSVLVAAVFFGVIEPHAAANAAWQPERFYAWNGDDWAGLVPVGLLQRLGFLVLVMVPLALLPLRSPWIAVAVVPLLEVLASRMSTTYTLGTHYAGAWAGYVLAAFAFGAAGLGTRAKGALLWALGLCVVELLVANPLHPGMNLRAVQPRDVVLDAVLARLPRDASIATQEEAYTHLALDDPYARLLPEYANVETEACLVLVDRDFPESPRLTEYADTLEALVVTGRYALVGREDGIEVYRRVTACR